MLRRWVISLAFAGLGITPAAAYECPTPTQQLAQDVSTSVKSEVSALGGLALTAFESKAQIVTRDLFEKYSDSGVVALAHTVISMFCQIVLPSAMRDAEKLDRLYQLEEWITRVTGRSVPMEKSSGTSCSTTPDEVLKPIKAIFDGWRTLNINQYLAQWGPEAIQRSKFYARRMADIASKRRSDFQTYKSVAVLSIDPRILFADGTKARVDNTYTMHFTRRSGKLIAENHVQESYILECSAGDRKWRIRENNDYVLSGRQ